MNNYGVKQIHNALREQLNNYIETEYFGKNDALRKACKHRLERKGVLYQTPYIESNPAYVVKKNGIANSQIPPTIKEILIAMKNSDLGVFENPYEHQITALEKYYQGNDIMVATGTGSGKTECFMWPIISRLISEAIKSPDTWKQRGIRTIIMYPMNALVADQLGRLRKMIGDHEGNFRSLFLSMADGQRIPQFGMYTGRTPYAGVQREDRDKRWASALKQNFVDVSEEMVKKLIDFGKYPSKIDLESFIEGIIRGKHETNPMDAELMSRFEMQKHCPDILITNYSMLEYMLMRPIEKDIWENTKKWLRSSSTNKINFIIDEAHMYRGSSGGEVAFLIRRMLNRIGASRKQVQFILTSASIPNEIEKVQEFATDLTGADNSQPPFSIIVGKQQIINKENAGELDASVFNEFNLDDFYQDDKEKLIAIKKFAKISKCDMKNCCFDNIKNTERWLYQVLLNMSPVQRILEKCREKAISVDELAKYAFPENSEEDGKNALDVMLAVMSLAKNEDGQILFPARLHMMFRGLQGVYACLNPKCSCKTDSNMKNGLGELYFRDPGETCKCGGHVYELLNHRTCGALFFRGYLMNEPDGNEQMIWSHPGKEFDEKAREVHFYLPLDSQYKKRKNEINCLLNTITGRIYNDDTHEGEFGIIRVIYRKKELKSNPNILTFSSCPKCGKKIKELSDFSTKGNDPFYNLISEQLKTQPPTLFKKEDIEKTPNEGKKVLLFSDSRQQAARLAKQLSNASDEEAMKNALVLAAKELQDWNGEEGTIDFLYAAFVKIVVEHDLNFFYGDSQDRLIDDIKAATKRIERHPNNYRSIQKMLSTEDKWPDLFKYHLLKQICDSNRSLTDIGCCWIEPSLESTEDLLDELESNDLKMSEEEFIPFFSAWCADAITSNYAIGASFDDIIQNNFKLFQEPGIDPNKIIPKYLQNILTINYNTEQISFFAEKLKQLFLIKGSNNSQNLFFKLQQVCLKYGPDHEWYKCPKCGKIFPYKLWDRCAHCGSEGPCLIKNEDFESVQFWRKPALKAVGGDEKSFTRINTEEHTAQLSHKDQIDNTWATTEEYEMRFQNIYIDKDGKNDKPIDVLSCTTTMEVGIDIGSLTAVGLRNIPPVRENYQQRAGRAGRRSTAVSSIVSYASNGPHDSYYFNHPEKIITGQPRIPWIDVSNKKIIKRHLTVVIMTQYLSQLDVGVDENVGVFFSNHYKGFLNFLNDFNINDKQLLPNDIKLDFDQYKKELENNLRHLEQEVEEFGERYGIGKKYEKKMLDCMLLKGLFPTYSFPRDVVGFYIEDLKGEKIEQEPDRSLDIAISEYAPGKNIVVNKKTYKSAGIYDFYSKFRKGSYEKPAKAYFEQSSQDYYKTIYCCSNQACNWFGLEKPHNNKCPFCGKELEKHNYLKPWGFAPKNGVAESMTVVDSTDSFAETPCYSLTPEDDLKKLDGFSFLRYTKRSEQPLIIINKGPEDKGFSVCELCGAAVPKTEEEKMNKIGQPFKHPLMKKSCTHPQDERTTVFLGHEYQTDMVVYEIQMNKKMINTTKQGIEWLKDAAQTLSEAMVLAAGRILDIEFNELKNGYRMRYSKEIIYIDVFLYDSLSSGAGYSSALCEQTDLLMGETKKLLLDCKCERACQDCLKHYWNQRVHKHLDRFSALDLIRWFKDGKLPKPLCIEEQWKLLRPLGQLLNENEEGKLHQNNNKIYLKSSSFEKEIYVYPIMWNKNNSQLPDNVIQLTDELLKRSLPYAFESVKNTLKEKE